MSVIAIAAVGKNYELGKDNDLIWRSKADLAHFKEETMGKVVVVGRKTYESMPALKGRTVVCLSKRGTKLKQKADHWIAPTDKVNAWELITQIAGERDIMIAGGAEIYKLFADKVDTLLLTRFDGEDKEADTYFPVDAYQALLNGSGELLLDKTGVTRYIQEVAETAPYELVGSMIVVNAGRRGNRRVAYVDRAIMGLSESTPGHGNKHITLHLINGETELIHFETEQCMKDSFTHLLNWRACAGEQYYEQQPMLDLAFIKSTEEIAH